MRTKAVLQTLGIAPQIVSVPQLRGSIRAAITLEIREYLEGIIRLALNSGRGL